MFHMPLSDVIEKISKASKLSSEEIKKKIDEKSKSLNGLVSEEGAAYIIANELGVKLFEQQTANKILQVKDILIGMKNVDVIGKVIRTFEPRSFTTREGKQGKVGNLIIADETGEIRVVLWDALRVGWLENRTLQPGKIVRIKNGYVRKNDFSGGKPEVHLGLRGQMILDVDAEINVKVPATDASNNEHAVAIESKISEVKPGVSYSLRGTVVRVYNPAFYEACKSCGKKVVKEGEKYTCKEHGEVDAKIAMVLSLILDDGTENIRCSAFQDMAEKLAERPSGEIQELSDEDTEIYLNKILLGIELEIEGFVKDNKAFNRIELNINKAKKPNASLLAQRLLE